jgi:hypothetical protein
MLLQEFPFNNLVSQKRFDGSLEFDNPPVAYIKYNAQWIYNKKFFIEQMLAELKEEHEELVKEIREHDRKL